MRVVSTLYGFLGKSGSKVNTPEDGDSSLRIPPILQPTLRVPFPHHVFYSAIQPSTPQTSSFMMSIGGVFNAGGTTALVLLGTGLWRIRLQSRLEEAGAVSDATSSSEVFYFANDASGTTVFLTKVTNKQGLDQNQIVDWDQLITSEQASFTFSRTNVAGLGTGLNSARHLILATRLF